jgi:hypothetical protein
MTRGRGRDALPLTLASLITAGCALALSGAALAGHDGVGGPRQNRVSIAAAQRPAQPSPAGTEARQMWRGELLTDLITRHSRREMSIPWAVTPYLDSAGINCSINQDGNVWFIGGSLEPVYTRTCTVPFGKAIVAPVAYYLNDFPCPDPQFAPAPGQPLEAFLQTGTADVLAGITLTEARLDGKPVAVRHIVTPVFGFAGAADLAANIDICITGAPQLGVTEGYFAFVEPPARGTHVLHIRSIGSYGESLGTVTLVVK